MVHPCHEPASDVAASGNSGEIVEFAQQPELRESLKDSKVKCGASDAAPGKSQPDQAVGRIPGVLFGFKPLKPAASNLLELTWQDMADSNSRDIETQSFSLVSWNTFGGAGRLRRCKSCYQRVAIRRTKPRASVPTGTSLIPPIASGGDVGKCCFPGCRAEQRAKVCEATRGMLGFYSPEP